MVTLRRASTTALLLMGMMLPACAGTKGRVDAGRYTAPSKNFSIPVPIGSSIQDDSDPTGGYVSFVGRYGGLSSVYYEKLPPEVRTIADDPNRREETFRLYLHAEAMPHIFQRASPQSALLHEEALGSAAEGAYFAIVNIPEGSSTFDVKTNRRLDSVRALLIFSEGDYLYMLAEDVGTGPPSCRARRSPACSRREIP